MELGGQGFPITLLWKESNWVPSWGEQERVAWDPGVETDVPMHSRHPTGRFYRLRMKREQCFSSQWCSERGVQHFSSFAHPRNQVFVWQVLYLVCSSSSVGSLFLNISTGESETLNSLGKHYLSSLMWGKVGMHIGSGWSWLELNIP